MALLAAVCTIFFASGNKIANESLFRLVYFSVSVDMADASLDVLGRVRDVATVWPPAHAERRTFEALESFVVAICVAFWNKLNFGVGFKLPFSVFFALCLGKSPDQAERHHHQNAAHGLHFKPENCC